VEGNGKEDVLSMSTGTWLIHETAASMNWVMYLAAEALPNAYVAASGPLLKTVSESKD